MNDLSKFKVLIAVPCQRTVCTEFFISMMHLANNGNTVMAMECNSLVYDARNNLTLKAIDEVHADYIMWIDSDMTFEEDSMLTLLKDAVDNDLSYVTGLTFRRQFPTAPTIAKQLLWFQEPDTSIIHGAAEIYKDYPKDTLFEIAGSGLAFTLVKVSAIAETAAAYKMSPYEPLPNLSEDYSFCYRLKSRGVKMYCDSRVKIGHVGNVIFNEETWLKQQREGDEK